jgi:Peptidase family M1 domain
MHTRKILRSLLPLLTLSVCSPLHAAIADKPGVPQVRIEISRRGDDWSAEFQFDRPAATWVFPRSDVTAEGGKTWREDSWTVETRGVQLQRRGSYDAFVAERGDVPLRVRIRFQPLAQRLQADYPPALAFTDGSIGLYVAQFDLFPMDSLSRVRALPDDLNNQVVPAAELHFVFRDAAGPVLLAGKRAAVAATTDKDTYVLFGATRPIETPYMVAVLDPQLPGWIRDSLSTAVPALLSRYTQELGPLPDVKPTIMISWAGPTPGIVSRAGSALHGLIVMTYEGTGMLAETAEQRSQGLWFIAHEAAHFWLGQIVSYQYARDAWITEGGADLLAIRAVAQTDPTYDPRVELNHEIEDCVSLTRRRGVASARDRNEHRAYYACGAVFGLVAEAGSGQSFFKFVRSLIDANRADGIVTRAEWLAALDAATRKPDLSRDIARLLDRGAPDPGAFIADLLSRAGVDSETDSTGIPRLR